jgi:hypothetical protein
MKSAMKNTVRLQVLLIVTFCCFAGRETSASQKKEGRITQVIQDVKLLPGNAAPRPAAVNDDVRDGTVVRTGQDSRTELTFTDQTLTRLGANSVFSFNQGTSTFDLGQGSILMQVPPDGSSVKVKTAAVTAAISGGTALFGVGPPMKFMVLEGTGTFYPPGHPEGITLHGGEMITFTPDGQLIGPTGFDVKKVLETAELLLPPFTDLSNLYLIWQVIMWQEADQTQGFKHSPKDPTEIDTRDQSAAASETPTPTPSTPTPTPSGTPMALKFGTPPTITSPVPYVINSTTVINTDPTITTNGVTDQGTIYRNPTDDGPRATWMFGSTSAFDTTSGFADGFDSHNMNNMAVFKFTSLQITGNPTVNVPGEGDPSNLGLIGVNGITTGGPGGVLTFDNVSMLLLATQNGSINLGSEVSFSGLDRMHIYARGTGSNLTINSAISTNNDLRLYSEGTVQANGTVNTINFSSFSGGDWLNGTGIINADGIYITSLGNITLDGDDLPDLEGGGGSISINATGVLTIFGVGGTNTRETFDLRGSTINLHSIGESPAILTLSAIDPTIVAGAGGIQAANVGLVGSNLLLQSDGDIHIYSVGVPANIIDGTIDAGGLFSASANVDTGSLTTGTSAFVGGDLSLSVAIIGTTLDVVGRLSASFVSAGDDITVGTLAVLDLTTPGILTETTGGIHPLVFDTDGSNDGAAAQHTFTVASIVSPNGIDFSGNQFVGIDGFSSGGLLTINATTITFGEGGIASANFNGANAGAFDDDPFTPASGGNGGTFIVNATGNITTVPGADITATTGLDFLEEGFSGSGNGGNVTLNSSGGTVTVDSLIQVSSNDSNPEGPIPIAARSASGGNITLHSGLTTGLGISIGGNAQLLSLLNHSAPGPGGTILITTAGADIHMGEFSGAIIEADRGTIDIHQTAPGSVGTSMIEIYNTALSAETISIASTGDFELGVEGFVIIDGITLSLTAANDLTMDGLFSSEFVSNSSGDVTISAGNNLLSTDDLTVQRRNGGQETGLNITISAEGNLTVEGNMNLSTDTFDLASGANISVTAGGNISVDGDLSAYAAELATARPVGILRPPIVSGDEEPLGEVTIHADGTITVGGRLNVLGEVSAGGAITAGTLASTNVTSDTSINALTGGITRFAIPGFLPEEVLHTLTAPVVTSTGGINFNGVNADGDFNTATDGGHLVINADSLSFGFFPVALVEPLGLPPGDIMGTVTFNGGDGSSTFDPGSGGTFTVNTTGDIDVNADIEATTGHFQPALSATPAGFGGTVNLNSASGTVTVNNRIEVSSAEPGSTIAPFRQSNSGGNIKITSGKTGGSAITIGSTAQLLSLLDTSATGGGGKIELSATGEGSSIDVNNANGSIQADQGTIDINHHGNNGAINISSANMAADVIKIQMFGNNGVLTIGGGTIDANSALTLYAAGSNGSIVFNANVTLSSNSAAIIAANTVTINNGVTVFINSSNAALVYANVANYSATNGGNGSTTGSFGGPGAPATTQPFPPPVLPSALSAGSVANTTNTASLASAGLTLPQSSSGQTGSLIAKNVATTRPFANHSAPGRIAMNVSNSAELLSVMETGSETGGKLRVAAKAPARNRNTRSTAGNESNRRGNAIRNGNPSPAAGGNLTSPPANTKSNPGAPVTPSSVTNSNGRTATAN